MAMAEVKTEMLVLKQRPGESDYAFEARVAAAGIEAADNTVIYIVPVDGRVDKSSAEVSMAQTA
jgi:hypothetical protein